MRSMERKESSGRAMRRIFRSPEKKSRCVTSKFRDEIYESHNVIGTFVSLPLGKMKILIFVVYCVRYMTPS